MATSVCLSTYEIYANIEGFNKILQIKNEMIKIMYLMTILQLKNSLSHSLNDSCVAGLDGLERLTELGQSLVIGLLQLSLVKLHQVLETLTVPIL